ncbi:hypothetical protein [Paracoccus pacificus]|uniref:Uncharacterized protein n=1 Tax=Paracoccus pacificus TaxID=1463598 RepID=A0ABW4R7Z4_9RHOB
MSRNARLLVLLAAIIPLAGQAETLDTALAGIIGKEVEIDGHIGAGLNVMEDEALAFRDGAGRTYPVVLDAGRAARKRLADCKFAMFGGGTPCSLKGKAEIEMDGSRIRLILFEATEIGEPAALK